MSILITGAQGFIGHQLISKCSENSLRAVGCVRTVSQSETLNSESVLIEDIVSFGQWDEISNGYAVIIHLAALAHFLSDSSNSTIE